MRANLKLVEGDAKHRKSESCAAAKPRTSPQTPSRPTNASLRAREYVTADEVERLDQGRQGWTMGRQGRGNDPVAYRHGLRAQEIADLEWSQVEEGRTPTLHVRRVKNGKPSAHPIRGDEMRTLRKLPRRRPMCSRRNVAGSSRRTRSIVR